MQSNQNSISLPQLGPGAQVLPSLPANYPVSDANQSSQITPTGSTGPDPQRIHPGAATAGAVSMPGANAGSPHLGPGGNPNSNITNSKNNGSANNVNGGGMTANQALMPLAQHLYGHQSAHTLPLPQLAYQVAPGAGPAQPMSISYLPQQTQVAVAAADAAANASGANDGEHVNSHGQLIGKSGKPLRNTKRAAQNRNAQKAFRQRRERYIKDLEVKAKEFDRLDAQLAAVQQENESLKRYVLELEQRLSAAAAGAAASGAGAGAGTGPVKTGM